MPALSNIVINDGAATPVAHTFSPASLNQSKNLAVYTDKSGGIAIGFPIVKLSLTGPLEQNGSGASSSGERVYRLKANLAYPVMEVLGNSSTGITPPPTVAYTLRSNLEFILPERSAKLDRQNLNALFKNLLSHTTFTAMVENLEAVW